MVLLLFKRYDSRDILYEQGHAVSSVGKGAVQPQEYEGGQGDGGATPSHDIHETANTTRSKEKQDLQ